MTDAASPAPTIYALTIERFRGIRSLKWKPSRGVNVILGGDDVGKTTILEAIALLLSPVNPTTLSDPDYYDRHIDAGFSIVAVLSMPAGGQMSSQMKPSWPWEWTGQEASVPTIEHDGQPVGEPVYRVRVRGTEDLELAYEIVQPDGSADSFPVALRRAIGLVRLSGEDRNDRDLRLVQGSALDRLLSDKGLRSRMASELAKNDVKDELTTEAQTALRNLDIAFKRESLPAGAYSGESCRVIRRNVYQSFRLNGATPSERSDAGVGLWINALVHCQSWWLFAQRVAVELNAIRVISQRAKLPNPSTSA